MAHLEEIGLPHRGEEPLLHRMAHVAGEHRLEAAVAELEHDGVLVGHELAAHPLGRRVDHSDHHRVDDERVARAGRAPLEAAAVQRSEELEIEIARQRLARLQHQARIDPAQHRGHPSQMIGVTVRYYQRR